MLFKGASQCCTPVSVKGPSLSFAPSFSLSLYACASEAHQSHTTVRCDECSSLKENQLCADFMLLISALNYNKTTCVCGYSNGLISEQA